MTGRKHRGEGVYLIECTQGSAHLGHNVAGASAAAAAGGAGTRLHTRAGACLASNQTAYINLRGEPKHSLQKVQLKVKPEDSKRAGLDTQLANSSHQ
jgi:hypothetical protein